MKNTTIPLNKHPKKNEINQYEIQSLYLPFFLSHLFEYFNRSRQQTRGLKEMLHRCGILLVFDLTFGIDVEINRSNGIAELIHDEEVHPQWIVGVFIG